MHVDMWRRKFKSQRPAGGPSGHGRRAERRQTNMLSCDLGEVLDISTNGMRVRTDGKPPVKVGQLLPIRLETTGHRLPVTGKPVRIKRRGLRTYEIGIQFLNVKPSVAAALESIALFGFIDFDAAAKKKKRGSPSVSAAVELPDYYKILGLVPETTDKDIKNAYRALALKYHPDVTDDPQGAGRFMQITQASEVLRDSKSRMSYDGRGAG